MAYEAALRSPTELLAPEAFPEDLTDLNGNAMYACDQNKNIDFHQRKSSRLKIRCLLLGLMFFIIASFVMAALFTWRMINFKETNTEKQTISLCPTRADPEPFRTLPETLETFLESWRNKIKAALKNDDGKVFMANIVYYDKVIWHVNLTCNISENEIQDIKEPTAYPVASITKVITALLAFKLHSDRKISLDDSIKKYEPGFSVKNPFDNDNGEGITMRFLISYLSGLPREGPCYPDNDDSFCPHNNSYVMQRIKESKLLFAPGTDVLYGNLPFAVAGNAMSKSYRGGYRRLVHDKVFVPLGMKKSFYNLNETIKKKIYSPLVLNGKVPRVKEWGWLDPAGGLLTTTEDLAKLEIALYNNRGTPFLKPGLFQEFFSPVYIFTDGKKMLGSSWDIRYRKGYLQYLKDGYVYGYSSRIFLIPHLRLAVNIFSTSTQIKSDEVEKKLQKLTNILHDELISLRKEEKPVPNATIFTGTYRTSDVPTLHNTDIKVSSSKFINSTYHQLTIKLDQYEFELKYVGDNVFEIVHDQCENFFLGVNGEKVYFDGPDGPNGKMTEFVIYGIHLRGKATFRRI